MCVGKHRDACKHVCVHKWTKAPLSLLLACMHSRCPCALHSSARCTTASQYSWRGHMSALQAQDAQCGCKKSSQHTHTQRPLNPQNKTATRGSAATKVGGRLQHPSRVKDASPLSQLHALCYSQCSQKLLTDCTQQIPPLSQILVVHQACTR